MAGFNFIERGVEDFNLCWDYQEKLLSGIAGERLSTGKPSGQNYFILVEHPPVYTLGKSGNEDNMLIKPEFLDQVGAKFYRINRGGDITFHGPGQLVGYPIIDLEYYRSGIREYIRKMEEAIVLTVAAFGLEAGRKEGATGVWLDAHAPERSRKICSIGVRVSRFVTMHGFALNVNTDLRYFSYINPCGFASSVVTSMEKELGKRVDMDHVRAILKERFNALFHPCP